MKFLHSYELFVLLIIMAFVPVILEICFFLLYKKIKFDVEAVENEVVRGNKNNIIISIKSFTLIKKCSIDFNIKCKFYEDYNTNFLFSVPAFFTRKITVPVYFSDPGKYNISIENIIISDVFGLFNKKLNIKKTYNVFVMPQTVENIEIKSGDIEIDMHWALNNYSSDRGDMSGVREYIPGDRLNTIHWKVGTKTDDIFVKSFEKTGSEEFIILFDFNRNYLSESFDFLYSAGNKILSLNKKFYVMWLNAGSEDLSVEYVSDSIEFKNVIIKLYNSYPIYEKGITLNAFKKNFGSSNAIYIGENRELI